MAAATALLVGLATGLGCCFSGPGYRGLRSDHFDGRHFHNPVHVEGRGLLDLLRWRLSARPGPWRDRPEAPPGARPPRRVAQGVRVTWINHSTTLIQVEGWNILTDPIWSERASPVSWAGPRRAHPPGIRFEDLPPIHLVVVSHDHYDHLDLPTLKRLHEAHHPRFVVSLGNLALLESNGIHGCIELDWWQSIELQRGLKVTCVPAQHFSGRGFFDRQATLWAGFVLEGGFGQVYFAGDTGLGPHFEKIRERFGAIRLALLPIGAFCPRWFMSPVHLSPEEALQAQRILGATTAVAIHLRTFRLADDGQEEPATRLAAALDAAGSGRQRFWVLGLGEGREVPPNPCRPPAHRAGGVDQPLVPGQRGHEPRGGP